MAVRKSSIYKLWLKDAQKIARAHGMSIRKTPYGDYRINFIGGKESSAVYEHSVVDALATAKAMYEHRQKRG